jgi:hypothetical protein
MWLGGKCQCFGLPDFLSFTCYTTLKCLDAIQAVPGLLTYSNIDLIFVTHEKCRLIVAARPLPMNIWHKWSQPSALL